MMRGDISRIGPFLSRRCASHPPSTSTSASTSNLFSSLVGPINSCSIIYGFPSASASAVGVGAGVGAGVGVGVCARTGGRHRWIGTDHSTYTPLPSSSSSRKKRSSKDNGNNKDKKRRGGRQSYRFVDRTRVQISGGSGGNGSKSMHHLGRKHNRRPDGGHGGNGGSVLIIADPREQSLRWTRPHVTAESGSHGGSQDRHGRNGKNTILHVPCGVVVRRVLDHDEHYDAETRTIQKISDTLVVQTTNNGDESCQLWERKQKGRGPATATATSEEDDHREALEAMRRHRQAGGYSASLDYDSDEEEEDDDDNNNVFYNYDDNDYDSAYDQVLEPSTSFTAWGEREIVEIADLDKPGSHIVVARGGRGGHGNCSFASINGPLPPPEIMAKYAEPEAGEIFRLELELKLIADIGLVGFPNAGKSSLLSATSRATPHIAPYPFTTLNPLVGYIEYKDGFRVCAADVPGLIAGASEGRGKGHDFLRHLERTKALLYIVDAAGIDGRDPVEDFEVLVQELSAYGDGDMLNRRCLVVANKIDLLLEDEREEICAKLQKRAEEVGIKMETDVLGISAGATGENLPLLTKSIRNTVLSSENDRTNEHAYAS